MNAGIRRSTAVSVAICATVLTSTSHAQSEGGNASAPAAQIEEIIVTAQKRSENLQKTPIALSAYTAAFMQDLQLSDVTEVARYAPNVQYSAGSSGSASASNLFIRGIGQIDFITTTDPGVATYLNGVYVARVTGAALDLADVERVEVLRGPQGTLFGRNTIGGAVSVVTARPTGQLSGTATLTAGNQSRLDGRLSLDFPIAETLAGQVSLLSRNSDGWGRNLYTGERLGKDSDLAGGLQLLWQPSSEVDVLLSGDYLRRRGTTMPHGLTAFASTPASNAFNAISPRPIGGQYVTDDPDRVQLDERVNDDMESYGVALTADWRIGGGVALKSITAYRGQNGDSGQDYDGTPAPYINQHVVFDQSQFSQELQFTGEAFKQRLKWLGGLYYFRETGQFDTDADISTLPVLIFTGNRTDSYAVFGQATYAVTDRLNVTAGARWTREKKQMDVLTSFAGTIVVPQSHVENTFSAFSPKLGLDYQLSDQIMVYGSATRGFRSGGFNGRAFSQADLTPFGEETATSYEIGLKSDWLERRLRVNTAIFYNDYKDIQLTATTLDSQGRFIVVTGNAARATLKGVEVEVNAVPIDWLTLFGSVGYLANELKENPGFSFGSRDLPSASKWSASAGGDVTMAAGSLGSMKLGVDYSFRSGYFPQYSNAIASYIKSYGLINARLSLDTPDDAWRFTLYGKNLANKTYYTFGQTAGSGDATIHWFAPTREFGMTVMRKF